MELQQLRYFLAVAKSGNFSRAAERCHVAQPSLSQQIQKLESELGEPLFERSRPTANLTLAGERLLPRALRILEEVDAATREVSSEQPLTKAKLVIAALPTIAPFLLPKIIRTFHGMFPEVELVVQEETTEVLLGQLAAREIEIGIASLPIQDERFATQRLFEEELLLAVAREHPLAKKRVITAHDLEQEPFILLKQGHCLGDQVLRYCSARDLQPRVSCRGAQLQTIQGLVEAGLGISFIPQMAVPPPGQGSAIHRSLSTPRPMRTIAAVWLQSRPQSRAVQEFLKVLTSLKAGQH